MSEPQEMPWSSNPNAPKIPYDQYFSEKASLSGYFIASVLYGTRNPPPPRLHACPSMLTSFARLILGIVVMLFFRSVAALLDPVHRRGERIKWGLVFYTMLVFSVVTVFAGMSVDKLSASFVDNREFPGAGILKPPGPLGYRTFIDSRTPSLIIDILFFLNGWLADGFLARPLFNTIFALQCI